MPPPARLIIGRSPGWPSASFILGEKSMLTTVEAVLLADGALHFLEPVHLVGSQRVLVTFTQPSDDIVSGASLSERSLSADWLREEEDAAWAHLQPTAAAGDRPDPRA